VKILVVKPSSLGDVVHALPTVNLIRKRFPDAHISWLINNELASLLKKCPVVNGIIEFPRHDYAKLPALVSRLRRERFDLVVDLQGLFRSGLMGWVTGASRRIGLSDAREGSRMFYTEIVNVPRLHAVDRYLLAAKHLGCGTGPVEFPLGLEGRAPSRPLIAVNPCARWETKLWGDDNFSALLDHLPTDRVVLIGSRSERDRIARINRDRARNLAGELDLYELADLYRQCAVVISNDTGPMHLAAAVGAPVIALFGPTDPALVGPYGSGHVVIRSPTGSVRAITVEQVLVAVKGFLA
jgi:lipopolysaccharide heptosyltransferase I